MLNFFALIKKRHSLGLCACLISLAPLGSESAAAQEKPLNPASKADAVDSSFSFLASARVVSPDGKIELGTQELRVNLNGNKTMVLKGRSLSVTLESETNFFRKTQMLKILASGGSSGSLNAGMFRLTPRQPHSFLYTDKNKGWILEVRLRPVEPEQLTPSSKKRSKSPVRVTPRKIKRIPA